MFLVESEGRKPFCKQTGWYEVGSVFPRSQRHPLAIPVTTSISRDSLGWKTAPDFYSELLATLGSWKMIP